jgi:ribonuclease-3
MGDLPESIAAADSLAVLESLLGYRFRDQRWLIRALTHRSFVNEQGEEYVHNESLEFLGDSVLGFLVSARIFQRFPDLSEGDLSKLKAYLVSAVNLVHLAERIKLGEFLRLSRGEEKTGGRMKKAILVDSYEAILGAIYLDGGIEAVSEFLERELGQIFERPDLRQLTYGDFKSALQEHLHNLSYPEPIYRVVGEIGPDHKKTFVVEVIIQDRVVAQASGKSKKEAQQAAAQQALERLM